MDRKTFGQRLKMYRLMSGLSQKDVADQLHKTTNAVSNWELGNTSPPIDDVMELCALYKASPNQLFGWEPYKPLDFYAPEYGLYIEDIRAELESLDQQKKDIEATQKNLSAKLRYMDVLFNNIKRDRKQ